MKKKSIIKPIISFFKESYQELIKVVWPSKKEVIKKTVIVVISMIIIALIITAIDYGLSKGVEVLINLK